LLKRYLPKKVRMEEFWDERYQVEEYVYGKRPNTFFQAQLDTLNPGDVLLPGEGEGRNAVYAAERGWNVSAFDVSKEGRNKALRLANERGVTIDYRLMPYQGLYQDKNMYDVIGLFFTHQPPTIRRDFHRNLQKAIRPGGIILLEAFHKDQLTRETGGPKNIDFLFAETDLREDFPELEILHLEAVERELDEGPFHQGEAVVVQKRQ